MSQENVQNHETTSFVKYTDGILKDSVLREHALGTKVSTLFGNEEFLTQCEEFASYCEDSTNLHDVLSPINWSEEYMTIGSVVESSQYQQQHGLSATAISTLFTDKTTGLLSLHFSYLFPIEVVETNDRTILVGGHTRLMSFVLMLRAGGAEWSTILDQEIRVRVGRFDIVKIAEAFDTSEDEAKRTVVPRLEATLWLASNKSRKPTSDESASFKDNKDGVNVMDAESIIHSNTLSSAEKASTLILSQAYTLGYIPDNRTGYVAKQFVMAPEYPSSEPARYWLRPPANTVRAIAKSCITALSRIKTESGAKKWLPSINSSNKFSKLVVSLFEENEEGLTMVDQAIVKGLQKSSGEYAGNIARNASSIGAALAELIDGEFEPLVAPREKGDKDKKATSVTKFRTRRLS